MLSLWKPHAELFIGVISMNTTWQSVFQMVTTWCVVFDSILHLLLFGSDTFHDIQAKFYKDECLQALSRPWSTHKIFTTFNTRS